MRVILPQLRTLFVLLKCVKLKQYPKIMVLWLILMILDFDRIYSLLSTLSALLFLSMDNFP